MGVMARLLIVHHAPTPTVTALLDAVLEGAHDDLIEGVGVESRAALEPDSSAVLAADGFVFVTPANFGYMSGALKHFFDSIFLEAGGALTDDGSAGPVEGGKKPYGLLVHGRYDTTGAVRSVQSILQALPWVQAAATVEILGDVGEEDLARARELGATIAAQMSI